MAEKVHGLRIFPDENGKMNLSLPDVGGEVLVVSNFTLGTDCKKGRRPSFDMAAPPEEANALYLPVRGTAPGPGGPQGGDRGVRRLHGGIGQPTTAR